MDQYSIHETVIRDIVDVIGDIKNSDEVEMFFMRDARKKYFKSISNATANLTLVFPVITSTNINIDNMSIVAKAIERKAVSMLQILFSAISITDAKDAFDHIRRVHRNLQLSDKMTVDEFIDVMDKFAENGTIVINDKEVYDAIKEDMKNLSYALPNNINESSLNGYKIYNTPYSNETMILNEADKKVKPSNAKNHKVDKAFKNQTLPSDNKKATSNAMNHEVDKAFKDQSDFFNNQILPSDIKKANELVPSMMIVNFVQQGTEKSNSIASSFIIGVKAKLYPVDSMDMINRIILKHSDKNVLNQFIRATTREISFMRDFIFCLDKAKMDALSLSKRGSSSKLWKVLERRAKKSKIRSYFNQTNDATAISTLVISQEEVEYLKKTENINLENPAIIRPIMESYNLMSVVIVDDSMEVANFIFDTGEDIYEQISFGLLEREASDSSYKKVINLISKMNKY